MKMPKNMLPIGSVVTLKNGSKKIMIVGRFQRHGESGKVFDYASVLWPEGVIDSKHIYLFDHSDIRETYFVGFKNGEEDMFLDVLEGEYEKLRS